MTHTQRLRELLAGPDTIVAPGMYDGVWLSVGTTIGHDLGTFEARNGQAFQLTNRN